MDARRRKEDVFNKKIDIAVKKKLVKYHCCKCDAELDIFKILNLLKFGKTGWRMCDSCGTVQLLEEHDD